MNPANSNPNKFTKVKTSRNFVPLTKNLVSGR